MLFWWELYCFILFYQYFSSQEICEVDYFYFTKVDPHLIGKIPGSVSECYIIEYYQ